MGAGGEDSRAKGRRCTKKPVPEASGKIGLGAWVHRGRMMAGSQLSIKDKNLSSGSGGQIVRAAAPPDRRKPFAARLASEKLGRAIMGWDALLAP